MSEGDLEATKPCPLCAETIKAAAVKCRYCGSDLTPGAHRALRQEVRPPPMPAAAAPVVIQVQASKAGGGIMGLVRNLVSLMAFIVLATTLGVCVICAKASHDVAKEMEAAEQESGASTPATASPSLTAFLDRHEALMEKVCACKTARCLQGLLGQVDNGPPVVQDGVATPAQQQRASRLMARIDECSARVKRASRSR